MPKRAVPLAIAVLSVACQFDDRVELLRIVRIGPGSVSAGDRVTVWGEGFPDGRAATVTFQGDVFRPAAPPERDVRFSVRAMPGPRSAVVFLFDAELERRLAGSGTAAGHATFHGDARVVFEPTARGVSSIAGTYRGLSLDVLPGSIDPETASQQSHAGAETLAFGGAHVAPSPGTIGLELVSVDRDGRFYAGGLRSGDRLTGFNGVTVMSPSDVRVVAGERTASVVAERNGRPLPPCPVDLRGLAPPGATSLIGPSALVLSLCLALAIISTPLRKIGDWLNRLAALRRVPEDKRARRHGNRLPQWTRLELSADAGSSTTFAATLVFAVIVAACASMALGRPLLTREIDLLVGVLVASVVLLLARFFDGGFGRGRRWSLKSAAFAGVATLACLLPALVALAGAVFGTGRFILEEMVADQGGVPWRWAGARNPGLTLLFFAFVASAIPESGYRGIIPAEGLAPASLPRATSRSVVRLAEWMYLLVVSAVASAVFLGGWRAPGVTYMVQETSRRLEVLGAIVFFLKFGVLLGTSISLRRIASHVFVEDVWPLFLRWVGGIAALGACVAVGWAAGFDGPRSELPSEVSGYASVALGAVLFGLTVRLVARRGIARISVSTVNPWL